MKTTNFEISKKLKEAGFKDSYIYAWYSDSEGLPWIQEIQHAKPTAVNKYREEVKLTFTAPAYDLETILDALPLVIERAVSGNDIYFKMNKNRVWYENSCNCDSNEYCRGNIYYRIDRQKNESLADTAGKMLIKLYEAGIINFKK